MRKPAIYTQVTATATLLASTLAELFAIWEDSQHEADADHIFGAFADVEQAVVDVLTGEIERCPKTFEVCGPVLVDALAKQEEALFGEPMLHVVREMRRILAEGYRPEWRSPATPPSVPSPKPEEAGQTA